MLESINLVDFKGKILDSTRYDPRYHRETLVYIAVSWRPMQSEPPIELCSHQERVCVG